LELCGETKRGLTKYTIAQIRRGKNQHNANSQMNKKGQKKSPVR